MFHYSLPSLLVHLHNQLSVQHKMSIPPRNSTFMKPKARDLVSIVLTKSKSLVYFPWHPKKRCYRECNVFPTYPYIEWGLEKSLQIRIKAHTLVESFRSGVPIPLNPSDILSCSFMCIFQLFWINFIPYICFDMMRLLIFLFLCL